MKRVCSDCGKALCARAQGPSGAYIVRCRPCSHAARRIPLGVCQECGKTLSYAGTNKGAKRCKKCADKRNLAWCGRHHTIESRQKISAAKAGYRYSEDVKKKLSARARGSNNPFWGKRHRPEAIAINRMKHSGPNNPGYRDGRGNLPYANDYPTIREMIRRRDDGLCQHPGCCKPENGRRHECHHIDRNKQNNHPSNLILLCSEHHGKTKRGDSDYWMVFYDSVQESRGIQKHFMEVSMNTNMKENAFGNPHHA